MSQPVDPRVEFDGLVEELDALLAQRSSLRDRKAVLDAGARRFEIQSRLIELLRPSVSGPPERRGSIRVPCQLSVWTRVGDTEAVVTARDLSCGGLALEWSQPVVSGAPVECELLTAPGLHRGGLRLDGRVAWAREGRLGVAFRAVNDGVETQILQLVLRLLKQSRTP